MIVSADGEVIDLTESQRSAEAAKTRRAHMRRVLLLGLGAVIVLGGATGVAVAMRPHSAPPAPAYQPHGVGATPPAAAPSGFAQRATWSQPVQPDSSAQLLPNGMLLTASADGYLEGLDPRTGEAVWRGSSAPDEVSAVRQTHWGDSEALVAVSGNSSVDIWPLTMPEGQSSVAPISFEIPNSATVHVDGGQPFVSLGDWYVGIPGDDGFTNVEVPPGSTPVNVTQDGHIIAVSNSTIYTLTATGRVEKQRGYTPPAGSSRMPTVSTVLDPTHVLLSWEDESGATGILNTATGQLSAATEVNASDEGAPLIDTTSKTAVVDSLAIDFGDHPKITELTNDLTPVSLHGRTIYGDTSAGPATLSVDDAAAEPKHWKAYTDEDHAPSVVTDDAAYLIGTQLDASTIYRVNHREEP